MTDIACRFSFDGIFALWVICTTKEYAKASAPFCHITICAKRAFDACRWVEAIVSFDVLTLGIVGTGDKTPKATVSFN